MMHEFLPHGTNSPFESDDVWGGVNDSASPIPDVSGLTSLTELYDTSDFP